MKKYLWYFLVSFGFMFLYSPDGSCSDTLTPQQTDSVFNFLGVDPSTTDLPPDTTATEIVKWLLRTLGSFISTLLLALLHKWFPNLFPLTKIKNYVKRKRPPYN